MTRIRGTFVVVVALVAFGGWLGASPASAQTCEGFTDLYFTSPLTQTHPFGDSATLSARLTHCQNHIPIVGQPIEFGRFANNALGPVLASDITDANGEVSVNVTSTTIGTEQWWARYINGQLYVLPQDFTALNWTKAPTVLKANPLIQLLNLTVLGKASATLTRTTPSGPVAGKVIQFSAGGRPICQATTNASGVAACSGAEVVSILLAGSYTATFAGDSSYVASNGSAGLL
jgi:hypothetical protein